MDDYKTEDYEKSFIEKYLERMASLKIDEILEKIKQYRENGKIEKIYELELEIEKIKEELVTDKAIVLEETSEKKSLENNEVLDFGWDAASDDTEVDSFNYKYRRAKLIYCARNGIPECEFEKDLGKRAEKYNKFIIPSFLWSCLFSYQQDGVKWLLGLYRNGKGGVLADDMGLGKTIQIIGFLTALFCGNFINRALILCPATVVSQWLFEWKKFYPFIRVFSRSPTPKSDGVYLMSYEKFKMNAAGNGWDVVILDEGHRIKNKDAQITHAVKKIKSEYKFALSGTPIQNNLGELWSIFDFVNPGLLGSYTSFYEEFEDVISQGGYKSASATQVERSYKHSLMLRSLIEPYILRRVKAQVSHKLPSKVDKIIFCSLAPAQIRHYNNVLESKHIMNVLTGKANFLSGISILRKVCNHPRLLLPKGFRSDNASATCRVSSKQESKRLKTLHDYPQENKFKAWKESEDEEGISDDGLEGGVLEKDLGNISGSTDDLYDLVNSSCKIKILLGFLEKWKSEGNKVLVFSQTIEMLNIIEECIDGYKYLRMDGTTPTSSRPGLVSRFNSDEDIFIFLLTTRVGGLGLNLTGASRIVIYDPDWNPSTDTQAKERAWRYGQKRDVEIYRFVCKDTIEEKIYQKQIFKDLLGKKILNNPRLNRFFNKSCIDELFSFNFTASKTEVRVHETQEFKDEGPLKEVKDKDHESFSRMKILNEKKILTGRELLEYIRLRENSSIG